MMDNFDWQNKFGSLRERNAHLLKSKLRVDCRFLVGISGDKKVLIEAHKFLLVNASPVFERMFYGSLPENGKEPIIIDDIEADVFKDFLEFIYTEQVKMISRAKLYLLYLVADKYMVDQCMKYCIKNLISELDGTNVCEIIEFARLIGNRDVEEICVETIIWNTPSVLASMAFYNANHSTLDTILSQDSLNINCELELFQALEKYASYRYTHDQIYRITKTETKICDEINDQHQIDDVVNFLKLVKKIRFLTMTPLEFKNAPLVSILLRKPDAHSILACLIDTKNLKNDIPYGFSKSKIHRGNGIQEMCMVMNCEDYDYFENGDFMDEDCEHGRFYMDCPFCF